MASGEARWRDGARRPARATTKTRRALVGIGAALLVGACGSTPHTDVRTARPGVVPEPRAILAALDSALPRLPRPGPASATGPVVDSPADEAGGTASALEGACAQRECVRLEHPPFVVYLPNAEAAAMTPYLLPLLDRAHAVLSARYAVGALEAPLRVELYADRAAYVARLRGRLPYDVEGAYENGVVLALSPAGGARNWGQTLFHELSHAYQDLAAETPLPRWVAEGLAELDARGERAEWRREYEGEFGDVLHDPAVGLAAALERTLLRPATERELGDAYWLSTEFVAFIEARHGASALRALLRAPVAAAHDDEARVVAATGGSLRDLEASFREARGPALAALADAHVPSLVARAALDTESVEASAPPAEPAASALAARAADALLDRQLGVARGDADRALVIDPRHRLALYVRARVALLDEDLTAEPLLRRLVEASDAYEARIALARAALLRDDVVRAASDARAALALDPNGTEAWDLQLRLHGRVAGIDRDDSRRRLVDLDERASGLAFELVRDAAARSDWARVRAYGERLLYVDPANAALHEALARAYAGLGDAAAARRERAIETVARSAPHEP